MTNNFHDEKKLPLGQLYAAFEAADHIVLKKYITTLFEACCIELSDELRNIEIVKNIAL